MGMIHRADGDVRTLTHLLHAMRYLCFHNSPQFVDASGRLGFSDRILTSKEIVGQSEETSSVPGKSELTMAFSFALQAMLARAEFKSALDKNSRRWLSR